MNRSVRTILAALALLLLVAGTAFATRSPNAGERQSPLAASHQPSSPDASDEEKEAQEQDTDANETDAGAQLTDDHASQLVDLLAAAGITATADELKALAAKFGVGGAVRLEAWAKATGKSVDELGAMFDSGMGWGAIAKQLEADDSSLNLSPGIGWIMGHGHGNENASAHSNANHDKDTGKPSSSD
jgi:hypothetical protein